MSGFGSVMTAYNVVYHALTCDSAGVHEAGEDEGFRCRRVGDRLLRLGPAGRWTGPSGPGHCIIGALLRAAGLWSSHSRAERRACRGWRGTVEH